MRNEKLPENDHYLTSIINFPPHFSFLFSHFSFKMTTFATQ